MTRAHEKNRALVVDIFAGCGGLSLGFRQAGFGIRVAVDNDQDSLKTFARNFNSATIFEMNAQDIVPEILAEAAEIGPAQRTVLIGGPPCQGFSTLRWGRKKGEDPRNMLVSVFADLVQAIKPDAWLLENVPTISNHIAFREALNIMQDGYELQGPTILEAAEYGVPQKRKRLFVIGTSQGVVYRFPRPSHHAIQLVSVAEAIGDLPSPPAWERSEDATLGAYPNHQKSNHHKKAISRLSVLEPGQSHLNLPEYLALDCHRRARAVHGGKVYRNVYGRMDPSLPSPTITCGCINVTRGRFGHPYEARAITPREAARLQSFPDSFAFEGGRESVARQIGNAVPVRLAKRLALGFKFPEAQRSGGKLQ